MDDDIPIQQALQLYEPLLLEPAQEGPLIVDNAAMAAALSAAIEANANAVAANRNAANVAIVATTAAAAAATNAAIAKIASTNAAAITAIIRAPNTAAATTDNQRGNNTGGGNEWWRRCLPDWLPLSDEATASFLSKVADTFVMGLVTLVIFIATYLLAWGKPGSTCITKSHNSVGGLSWVQLFIAPLPFAVFPFTLFFNGLAKVAEKDYRALNFVACCCLAEFVAVIVLGAAITYCVATPALVPLGGVTLFLLGVLAVAWGSTFKYPKCLRQ